MIIGADVGGTFTDLVAVDAGAITTAKVPTSALQSTAVAGAAASLAGDASVEVLLHGTTVATNALLEHAGARTALVTDPGFEDVIEIGRQHRPSLYDPDADRAPPLVDRADRLGVSDGLDPAGLGAVEAVAVAFIAGHTDPARERAVADTIRSARPELAVSLSSEVSPEFREFERISTTVLNAYLTPVTSAYLDALRREVVDAGVARTVSVMRSSGGTMSVADAAALPAAVVLSGPAGGVVAARDIARRLGHGSVVSFDMGGTSTDVCLIEDGAIDVSYEREVAGYTCRLPAVGIHTVGAGGGSVAWVDAGGSLRVGPRSAGADPGPACYRRGGTEPTVTDANVVLGRIDPELRLGGTLPIDADRAADAVGSVGRRVGLGLRDTALGIVRIAEETMAGAVRTVSVDQGTDPGAAHLLAFGGAGGLHATSIARTLSMAGVIVPPHAGVFSALGLLLAPPRADVARAIHITDGDLTPARTVARGLRDLSSREIVASGHDVSGTEYALDVRYLGQAHEIAVPWHPEASFEDVLSGFEDLHTRRYGFARHGDPLEVVTVRCAAFGEPPLSGDTGVADVSGRAPRRERPVVAASGAEVPATVVDRRALAVGEAVDGPAIVEETEATVYLGRGDRAVVADDGSLLVSW